MNTYYEPSKLGYTKPKDKVSRYVSLGFYCGLLVTAALMWYLFIQPTPAQAPTFNPSTREQRKPYATQALYIVTFTGGRTEQVPLLREF